MIKQKVYLLLENLDELGNLNIEILFHLTFVLKPNFNCCNSFSVSWVHKVTTGAYIFVSVNVNVGTWLLTKPSIIKQFADQVIIRLISQLINVISRVL